MPEPLSRRDFVKLSAAAGGAAIIGFDPRAGSWVTQGQHPPPTFRDLPRLDGELLLDEASRDAIAVDASNTFHSVPAAVLRPRSAQDVVAMVRYCNRNRIRTAIKGDGHSQYGITQVAGGLVIDCRSLNGVESPREGSIDVQPGAYWAHVAEATLAQELMPRVFPATCMALTVGGTLSVGGIGNTSPRYGALVDNVEELDVVTGDGRLVTCSADRESELFNMVSAGVGQCGVIVRARVPLIPAPSHVLLHELTYDHVERYLADQLRAAADGRFDSQRGHADRRDGLWSFIMEAGKAFTAPSEPDLGPLEADLRFDRAAAPRRMRYREYLFRFEARNAATLVSRSQRAYLTMWIPASAAAEYLARVCAIPPQRSGLPREAGAETFSLYPLNTERFTRPLFRVPGERQAMSLWLFRSVPAGDQAGFSAMLESNRELLAKMSAVGGKRYSPYAGVMSPEAWRTHFGPEVWARLSAAKKGYDPNGVLSPGAHMF